MWTTTDYKGCAAAIADLVAESFAVSEGAEEGRLVGDLARRLMAETPPADLRVVSAWEDEGEGRALGAVFFSRLTYDQDPRAVFVLGPAAVAPDRQRRGIGQALIAHGIDALRAAGVDVLLTYGDPAYYGRAGFRPIDQAQAAAPFPLRHPEGWQGRGVRGAAWRPLAGPCRCVAALADPVFW